MWEQATRLVELLDEAKNRCKATIQERPGNKISAQDLEEASSIMGYGAIKYADLKNNRKTDYKCAPEGFTAFAPMTLLSTHVRRRTTMARSFGKCPSTFWCAADQTYQFERTWRT